MTAVKKDQIEEFVDWVNLLGYHYDGDADQWNLEASRTRRHIKVYEDGYVLIHDGFTGLKITTNLKSALRILGCKKEGEELC